MYGADMHRLALAVKTGIFDVGFALANKLLL